MNLQSCNLQARLLEDLTVSRSFPRPMLRRWSPQTPLTLARKSAITVIFVLQLNILPCFKLLSLCQAGRRTFSYQASHNERIVVDRQTF